MLPETFCWRPGRSPVLPSPQKNWLGDGGGSNLLPIGSLKETPLWEANWERTQCRDRLWYIDRDLLLQPPLEHVAPWRPHTRLQWPTVLNYCRVRGATPKWPPPDHPGVEVSHWFLGCVKRITPAGRSKIHTATVPGEGPPKALLRGLINNMPWRLMEEDRNDRGIISFLVTSAGRLRDMHRRALEIIIRGVNNSSSTRQQLDSLMRTRWMICAIPPLWLIECVNWFI